MELTEQQARILIKAAHGMLSSNGAFEAGEAQLWMPGYRLLKADGDGTAQLTALGRKKLAAYFKKQKDL